MHSRGFSSWHRIALIAYSAKDEVDRGGCTWLVFIIGRSYSARVCCRDEMAEDRYNVAIESVLVACPESSKSVIGISRRPKVLLDRESRLGITFPRPRLEKGHLEG